MEEEEEVVVVVVEVVEVTCSVVPALFMSCSRDSFFSRPRMNQPDAARNVIGTKTKIASGTCC